MALLYSVFAYPFLYFWEMTQYPTGTFQMMTFGLITGRILGCLSDYSALQTKWYKFVAEWNLGGNQVQIVAVPPSRAMLLAYKIFIALAAIALPLTLSGWVVGTTTAEGW